MSEIQQFSQHDIEVLNEETVYKGFFTLKKVQFKHKLFAGGESGVVTRELLVKGAASAVIAYDPEEDAVVLVEQVRIGAYQPESILITKENEQKQIDMHQCVLAQLKPLHLLPDRKQSRQRLHL